MKQLFFPSSDLVPHGLVVTYPDEVNTLDVTTLSELKDYLIIQYAHGKGALEDGRGSITELKQMVSHPISKMVYDALDNNDPKYTHKRKFVFVQVQTITGYQEGELQYMEKFVKDTIKPTFKPVLVGYSWGAYGIVSNIKNNKLQPENYSAIHLISGGQSVTWANDFSLQMLDTGKDVPVYLYHNENDKIADVGQTRAIYNDLKAKGFTKVNKLVWKNVWTSSDGTQTSHGSPGYVFVSDKWTMYSNDPAAVASKAYSTEVTPNFPKYFYENMYNDLVRVGETVPTPAPVPDVMIYQGQMKVEVWKNAAGEYYFKFLN